MKYESLITYYSKDMANISFCRQQAKNCMPLIFRHRGIKMSWPSWQLRVVLKAFNLFYRIDIHWDYIEITLNMLSHLNLSTRQKIRDHHPHSWQALQSSISSCTYYRVTDINKTTKTTTKQKQTKKKNKKKKPTHSCWYKFSKFHNYQFQLGKLMLIQ
jgi:hypothetical protein